MAFMTLEEIGVSYDKKKQILKLSLIHISEPTRP